MTSVLCVVTATVFGVMVGVEFSVAFVINPIMLRLPDGQLLEARADGGRMLGRAMPPWYIGSLMLMVALAVATWGTTTAVLTLVAAVLLGITVVMSLAWLVPINNRSSTWTADEHPADWREQMRRWDSLHYLRVAIIVAAFVLLAAAVVAY